MNQYQYYGQPYQAGPNLPGGAPSNFLFNALATEAYNRGYVPHLPLYTNNGSFMDAAQARYYDAARVQRAQAAAELDSIRLANAAAGMMRAAGRDVTPAQYAIFQRAANFGISSLGPMASASAGGRAALDVMAGGVSAVNIATSLDYMGRGMVDPGTGQLGMTRASNLYMTQQLHNHFTSNNQYGIGNNYGMTGDAISAVMARQQLTGVAATPSAMARLADSQFLQRANTAGVNMGAIDSSIGNMYAAGWGNADARREAALADIRNENEFNSASRLATRVSKSRYGRLDEVMADGVRRRADKNMGWFGKSSERELYEAAEYESVTGNMSESRKLLERAKNDPAAIAQGLANKGIDIGPDTLGSVKDAAIAEYQSAVQKKIDRLDALKKSTSDKSGPADAKDLVKMAALVGSGAAFNDKEAARTLNDAMVAIERGDFQNSEFANMSKSQQNSILSAAGVDVKKIQDALKTGSADSIIRDVTGGVGLQSGEDLFGLEQLSRLDSGRSDVSKSAMDAAIEKQKKLAEKVARAHGALSRVLIDAGEDVGKTAELIEKLGIESSAALPNEMAIDNVMRIEQAARHLGLGSEEIAMAFDQSANAYASMGYVDPKVWGRLGVATELEAYRTVEQGGFLMGGAEYGSASAPQVAQMVRNMEVQSKHSLAAKSLGALQNLMSYTTSGDPAARAELGALLERSKTGGLTDEDKDLLSNRIGEFQQRIASGLGQSVSSVRSAMNDNLAVERAIVENGIDPTSVTTYAARQSMTSQGQGRERMAQNIPAALQKDFAEIFTESLSMGGTTDQNAAAAGALFDAKLQEYLTKNPDSPEAKAAKDFQARGLTAKGAMMSQYDANGITGQNANIISDETRSSSFNSYRESNIRGRARFRGLWDEISSGLKDGGFAKFLKKMDGIGVGSDTDLFLSNQAFAALGVDVGGEEFRDFEKAFTGVQSYFRKNYGDKLDSMAKEAYGIGYEELTADQIKELSQKNVGFGKLNQEYQGAVQELIASQKAQEESAAVSGAATGEGGGVGNVTFSNATIMLEGEVIARNAKGSVKPNSGGGMSLPDTKR